MSLAEIFGYEAGLGWQSLGACRGSDPDLFFPERGQSSNEAKEICADCPVADKCLQFALDNLEMYGIWGGKSERQRRALRKSRAITLRALPTAELIHGRQQTYRRDKCRCAPCRAAHSRYVSKMKARRVRA